MKILWVTNIPLPEASLLMNEEPASSGGWLINAADALAREENIKLEIAFPKTGTKKVGTLKGEKVCYYSFPFIHYRNHQSIKDNTNLLRIIDQSQPDIVHIFGTEFAHTAAMVNVCRQKSKKFVISIQGLVSEIAKQYTVGLPRKVQYKFTFRDFIKQDSIKQQQRKFEKRGKHEIEALLKASHIIGRTTWDRACTSYINQSAEYHHCNETLRSVFYQHQWNLNKCEKYSIFLSQGSYPIKGLHFLLEALPLILNRFPDTRLYIGGPDITKTNTLKDRFKISSYGKYIKDLIKKYHLQNHIIFTGILNADQMCEQYLKSHVYVCSSMIENSPNSLGEAMILGVPSVAADVGGIADLLTHKKDGFIYPSNAPYMMAHYVNEIFSNNQLALEFSKKAKIKASIIFNKETNNRDLLRIYHQIITNNAESYDNDQLKVGYLK